MHFGIEQHIMTFELYEECLEAAAAVKLDSHFKVEIAYLFIIRFLTILWSNQLFYV